MDEIPKKPSDKRNRSDNEKLSSEVKTYQTSKMDKRSYSRRNEITAEYAVAGFRKVVTWASVIVIPIAAIISCYNSMLAKVSSLISEQAKVSDQRLQQLEHDSDKQDERIRELEKK